MRQWLTELRLTPKAKGKGEAGEDGGIAAILREMGDTDDDEYATPPPAMTVNAWLAGRRSR